MIGLGAAAPWARVVRAYYCGNLGKSPFAGKKRDESPCLAGRVEERRAAEQGSDAIRLETNRSLTEAIELYRSAGYDEVAPFNDERYANHWFEKRLDTLDSSGRNRE